MNAQRIEKIPARIDKERIMIPSLDASVRGGVINGDGVGNGLAARGSEYTVVVAVDAYTVERAEVLERTTTEKVVDEGWGVNDWEKLNVGV